jgi:hypothetical protein
MTALYVDFSYTKPTPAAVKASGYQGVIGYLSPEESKNLTLAEYNAYRAEGLDVLLVWEYTGTDSLQGAAAGASDVAQAEAQAASLGYPADSDHPIFYATDFGPTTTQMSAVLAYYEGVAGAKRAHGFGPYGNATVVNTMHSANIGADAFWQTVAWSGGVVSPIANLYQRLTPTLPAIPGGGYDEDALLIPFPSPNPAPASPGAPTNYPEDNVQSITIQVGIDGGEGWCEIPDGLTAGAIINVVPETIDPATIGAYAAIPRWSGVTGDNKLVFNGITTPNGTYGFIVWATS